MGEIASYLVETCFLVFQPNRKLLSKAQIMHKGNFFIKNRHFSTRPAFKHDCFDLKMAPDSTKSGHRPLFLWLCVAFVQ